MKKMWKKLVVAGLAWVVALCPGIILSACGSDNGGGDSGYHQNQGDGNHNNEDLSNPVLMQVTYHLNGGHYAEGSRQNTQTFRNSDYEEHDDWYLDPDNNAFTLVNPVRDGYVFAGWLPTADAPRNRYTVVNELYWANDYFKSVYRNETDGVLKVELFASWIPLLDCLRYEINGGAVTLTGFTDQAPYYAPVNIESKFKTDYVIPATIEGKPVTAIAERAFERQGNGGIGAMESATEAIKSIYLPDSITTIGEYAFSGSGVESVRLPENLTVIEKGAFAGCALSNFVLPASVTTIKENAFGSILGTLEIPETVTSLADKAFGTVEKLIFNAKIPFQTTCFGERTYPGHSELYFGDNVDGTTNPYGIQICNPFQVVHIGKNMADAGVKIDGAITEVYYDYNCYMLDTRYATKPVTIYLGANITKLPETAFRYSENISKIVLHKNTTQWSYNALEGCTGLTAIDVPNLKQWLGYSFTSNTNPIKTTCVLQIDGEPLSELVIPNDVTTINSYAFSNCKTITSLTINGNVTTLGDGAFNGCSNLATVNVDSLATWLRLGSQISTMRMTNVPYRLYVGGQELTDFVTPTDTTTVAASLFQACGSLENVTIGASVNEVYLNAIDWDRLSSLTFAETSGWTYLLGGETQTVDAELLVDADAFYAWVRTFNGDVGKITRA